MKNIDQYEMLNQNYPTDIFSEDADCLKMHISLASALLEFDAKLNEHHCKFISAILKEIAASGIYKIPKRHGGQRKNNQAEKELIAYSVMKSVKNNYKVCKAIQKAADKHIVSYSSAHSAYYQYRKIVEENIRNIPDYKHWLEQ